VAGSDTVPSSDPGGPRLFVGTTNPAKADRLRRAIADWPFETLGPEDLPVPVDLPPEMGSSHLEIAVEKALAWSRATGLLTIASDGGLAIPALGASWNSLTTRRSAGPSADDQQRIRRLVELMDPHTGDSRRASWSESVAVVKAPVTLASWQVEGPTGFLSRRPSPISIDGFWAASLWYFPEFGKAYTELSDSELEAVGDPWVRLTRVIQEWLASGGWEQVGGAKKA
jgi:inosine/xanthosine triphosphate pyrophosphatase family protein